MGNRVTLVLAVALVAAGLYAWFDLQPREGRSIPTFEPLAPTPEVWKPLLEFAPQAVEAIDLRQGQRELHTSRDNGGWTGVSIPARVDDFLRNLREMVEIMTLEAPAQDLSDFGLDQPEGRIVLRLRDAPPIHVLIGSRNPPGTATYAGIGGRVVLTGALLHWEFEKLTRALTETGGSASPDSRP